MVNQYKYQYNYYCAIHRYRGSFKDWLKWRNRQALYQMRLRENCG